MPERGTRAQRWLGVVFVAAGATILAPSQASAQRGPVVSKEIGVGRNDASLHVGFADSVALDVELRDGFVRLNGESIGRYRVGGELDAGWRALLERASSLDGAALADRLVAWRPPADLPANESGIAARIDGALETTLTGSAALADSPTADFQTRDAATEGVITALLRRPERMIELGRALVDRGLDDAQVHVGENVLIGPGETVQGDLVVVDGDLDVSGEIEGDVVVVGGNIRLVDGGRVTGDVRVSDGRALMDGGEVLGDVNVSREQARDESVRTQVDPDVRREIREPPDRDEAGPMSAFRSFGRELGNLVGSMMIALLIAFLGGLAVHFARDRLEVVAETARAAPIRAGMVGLAGAFLAVPAWILGGLGLIVTIVGILALPFWIVLFPLAVGLAIAIGYLGVAQGVGEWLAGKRYERLAWVRDSNPLTTVIAGVGALMLAFVASNAIETLGFFGFASGLLMAFAVVTTVAALLVGFGAVLLTRGGRRSRYADARYGSGPWDDDDLGFTPWSPMRPWPSRPGPESGGGASAGPKPSTSSHEGESA